MANDPTHTTRGFVYAIPFALALWLALGVGIVASSHHFRHFAQSTILAAMTQINHLRARAGSLV